ncbi:outer membrane protein assembly factor [Echinicola soli]|uniref:Outer membrane protein assembly factor n=1 Tax=Echinicola soli TaxID=2591634 RepID=A0A514CEE3_9BACT|nr:POTRA domain-containing protein [Echinicola soli]QDH78024.1 outer membrane protein assembly factor [Echinicola soli]
MKRRFIIALFFACWFSTSLLAQQRYALHYEIRGEKSERGSAQLVDSLAVNAFMKAHIERLREEGYLMAEVERKVFRDSLVTAHIQTHGRFDWVSLESGNLPDQLLRRAGYDARLFQGQPVSYQQVARLFDRILELKENEGFPFAAVRLDSIRQGDHSLRAHLALEEGPYIRFDSLNVLGNARVKVEFLARSLGIVPGEPYSQKKVQAAIRTIQNIPYYKLEEPPRVSFQNSEATLYLTLKNRKINTLDGIIGLLPNEAEANKLLVTGQFDLDIYNPAGKGRQYGLHWQRLTQYSQNLEIAALEPQIFGTGIDVNASFFLLKEDTSFVNRDFRFGFGFQVTPQLYMDFFSRWQSGDLLSVPEVSSADELPEVLDFRYHSYGVRLSYHDLDDGYLPMSGWRLMAEGGVGNKKILHNTAIEEVFYESVGREALQAFGTFSAEEYWRVSKRLVGFLRLRGGLLYGDNILKNDMYRLGGLRSIRGFNENFFFANRYVYANFEPRFYFEENSYFLLFTDVGALEQSGWSVPKSRDKVLSFGGGLNLSTGSGEFRFLYGMGKSNEQKMGINYAKIHFGYIGRF